MDLIEWRYGVCLLLFDLFVSGEANIQGLKLTGMALLGDYEEIGDVVENKIGR